MSFKKIQNYMNVEGIQTSISDMTQAEMAQEIGISIALYREIENNDYIPKWQVRQKIANYFHVDQSYFWSKK
jgi:DNA-binding XRE family transcriptional regulator